MQSEEVASGRLIEVTICFFRTVRNHDTLPELSGAFDRGLNHGEQFEGKRRPEQVVLLTIEGTLNLLPGGGWTACRSPLQPGERCQSLPCMLNEALAHFLGEVPPPRDKRLRIRVVPLPKLVIEHIRHDAAQLPEATAPGQFGDRIAKLPPRRVPGRHLTHLFFELCNAEGHRAWLHNQPRSNSRDRHREIAVIWRFVASLGFPFRRTRRWESFRADTPFSPKAVVCTCSEIPATCAGPGSTKPSIDAARRSEEH